jgi:hypothetical protein
MSRYVFSFVGAAALVALAVVALGATAVPAYAQAPAAVPCPALLDREFNRLQTGKPVSLCPSRGKVLLGGNTAC